MKPRSLKKSLFLSGLLVLSMPFVALADKAPAAKDIVKPVIQAPTDENATRIILLGTAGGPLDRTTRSEPATLLVVQGIPYLIDAGAGVVRRIAQAGFTTWDIRKIFLTHLHVDHQAGLEPFISTSWINGTLMKKDKPEVDIYGPPSTKFLVDQSLKYLSVSQRIFEANVGGWLTHANKIYFGHDVEPGVIYNDGLVKVTAVENTHYHFKPGELAYKMHDKSYSYRFDTPEGAIVFTGDTGPCKATTKLAKGAKVLISEAIDMEGMKKLWLKTYNRPMSKGIYFHMTREHLTPESVGKMAQAAGVHMVILHHLAPGFATDRDSTVFTAGVEKYYHGPVIAGRDLMEYDIYKQEK